MRKEFDELKKIEIQKLNNEIISFNCENKSYLSGKSDEIIEINAGGSHILATTRSTLTKVFFIQYSNSLLALLFGGKIAIPLINGKVFIDRDGEIFSLLISYLRNGKIICFDSQEQKRKFLNELAFWNIKLDYPSNIISI